MRANQTKYPALAMLIVGLAACAGGSGDYPSLAVRPIESGVVAEPAPPTAPIRPATPAARLAALRDTATKAHAAFTAREREAERLARAAAGRPFESAQRAAAMVALAELDAQRGVTAGALAALDSLAAEAAGALSPDPALTAVQTDVAATLAQEDSTIARLWGVMES